MGAALVVVAIVVFLGTALVAVLHLPPAVLGGVVLVALLGALGCASLLRGAYAVRLDEAGYHVRFVRGAGVKRARWVDVAEASTAEVAGSPCVVLRLSDGRRTAIPVEILAVDRDQFVREIQEHLRRGHGLTRLS
jgi:hypothetical protein